MGEQTALFGWSAGAKMSDNGRYRWHLWRTWSDEPPLGWIMLNPSTADADSDDPTIRRCVGFAQRDGYGGISVVNLFGLRATVPSELDESADPVGRVYFPGTDHYRRYSPWSHLNLRCGAVVVGWGAAGGRYADRVADVVKGAEHWRPLLCLGKTKDGHPRHPLYVPGDQPLVPWRPHGG